MVYIQKTENKYHAKSQTYNQITYHSKFEAGYAQALDLAVKSGEIKKWDRQVKLDLKVNGQHITNYYIDFIVYHNGGSREFIEVKGFETEVWRMKWKILEATFEQFKQHPDDSLSVIKQTNWGPPRKRK